MGCVDKHHKVSVNCCLFSFFFLFCCCFIVTLCLFLQLLFYGGQLYRVKKKIKINCGVSFMSFLLFIQFFIKWDPHSCNLDKHHTMLVNICPKNYNGCIDLYNGIIICLKPKKQQLCNKGWKFISYSLKKN